MKIDSLFAIKGLRAHIPSLVDSELNTSSLHGAVQSMLIRLLLLWEHSAWGESWGWICVDDASITATSVGKVSALKTLLVCSTQSCISALSAKINK